MKPAEFHPGAEKEATAAARRYEKIQPGLGSDFQTELAAALTRIRSNPFMYAAETGRIRIAPLHRFPYGLIRGLAGSHLDRRSRASQPADGLLVSPARGFARIQVHRPKEADLTWPMACNID